MQARNTFALGLTSILALAGLAMLLFLFGSKTLFSRPGWPLIVETTDAAGLRKGGTVFLNGVQIGQITEVSLQNDPAFPVRVEARIDKEHRIRRPATFEIVEPLIGGSAALNIIGSAGGDLFPDDRSETLQQVYQSQLQKMTDLMGDRFTPLMEAMDAFEQFSLTYAELGHQLQELLEPQDPALHEPGNLRTAVAQVNELLSELTESVDLASAWLRDEDLRLGLTAATDEARRFFTRATETAEHFGQLADSLESDTQRITEQVLPVLDRAAVTLEELQRVALAARMGEGTMAQMLNNPDLYNSLDDAAKRLDRTAADLQLLIQKWKAEGVSVNF